MPTETTTPRTAVFGPYLVDLRSGELRKHGTRVKLGEQPLQILVLLLERSGQLVTREELRARLWVSNTFVDFEHSLNSAVQRLRDALSDSAGEARWIETVPRRGYRFLGEVEWKEETPGPERPAPTNGRSAATEVGPSSNKTARGVRTRRWALVAAVLVSSFATSLWIHQKWTAASIKQVPSIRSMAVLPLENLSGDPQQDYFADGMTDELITMLAKNASLRVISRTTVMQYKGVHRPLRDIARELGVDGIVEGSVVRTGEKVRVTAQLIHASTDTHLWAESYERDVRDVIALQKDVAEAIAARVDTNLSPSSRPAKPINPEALDAYLRGRYFWFGDGSFERCREFFEKAIRLQPDYAAAWSGLADTYAVRAVGGASNPKEDMPKAEELARKALTLDDSSAEAHNSLAAVQLFYKWDWTAADKEVRRAIELNPNFAEAHHLRCYVLQAMSRNDEAIEEAKKAIELDPRARPWGLGFAYLLAHRFDEAVTELEQRSEANPQDPSLHAFLAHAYKLKGREKESIEELVKVRQLESGPEAAEAARRVYDKSGYRGLMEWQLARQRKIAAHEYLSPLQFAELCARLGDKEQTLRYLELAARERASQLVRVHLDPEFDFLHSDPRFQAFLKNVGLTLPASTQAALH